MPSLAKRLGFARSNTEQGQVPVRPSIGSVEMMPYQEPTADDVKGSAQVTSYEMDTSVPKVNERKLSVFRAANRWDPNLSNDILDDIDDALDQHDAAAEGHLAGEILENSPYPEVSHTTLLW